jgi:hypothetical protein
VRRRHADPASSDAGTRWKTIAPRDGAGMAIEPCGARVFLIPDQTRPEKPIHSLDFVRATDPRRIFIGGGVPQSCASLLPAMRRRPRASRNGYLELDAPADDGIDRYVAAPGLGALAGPLGALALALAADAYAAHAPARSAAS